MSRTKIAWGLTDKELEKILKVLFKHYIAEKSGAQGGLREGMIPVGAAINDPTFASVVAAYTSLRHQERQDRTNLIMQALILIVAAANLVWPLVQLLAPHSP